MNRKENAGYQRTHAAIQEALLKLAEQKDWRTVTVNELCKAVGINRSTFYAHFQDLYAVMESLSQELGEELVRSFRESRLDLESDLKSDLESASVLFSEESFLLSLKHVYQHRSFYRLYLSESSENILNQSLRYMQVQVLEPFLKRRGTPERLGRYYTEFYQAGILTVVRQWLQDGCPETPEEMAELLRGVILVSEEKS